MIELDEYAKFLEKSAKVADAELLIDGEALGEEQKKIAKEMIGRENPQWPELADTTIDEKSRLGFDTPAPLLRTGELRDSIDYSVEPVAKGVAITLGSDDPVAAYQELGTATIPPRPFLSTAQLESVESASKIMGDTAVKLLVPMGERPATERPIRLPITK